MRAWVRTDRLTGLNLTTGDIINAIQAQNVQAAVGRVGARPISDEQQLQLNIQTKGRLISVADFENIVVRTNPDGSVLRLGDVARLELGAANLDRDTRLNGGGAAVVAIYQSPGANAIATLKAVRDRMTEMEKPISRGPCLESHLRSDLFRHGDHRGGPEDADRGIRSGGAGGLSVPRQRAGNPHTDDGGAGEPHRHVHRVAGDRLLRQFGFAAGPGARHRYRGGRCDRGGRKRRTRDGGTSRTVAIRSHQEGDGGNHRPDHCHHAGAALGVRAGRLHPGHFGRAVPPVRRDGGGVDVPVCDQRADAVAGAVRRAAAAASRAAARHYRQGDARDRSCARRLWGCGRPHCPLLGHRARACGRCRHRRGRLVESHPNRIPARGRPGRPVRGGSAAGRRFGGADRGGYRAGRGHPEGGTGHRGRDVGRRPELHRQLLPAERGLHGRHAQIVRRAQGSVARRARFDRPSGAQVPADPRRHGGASGAAADPRPRLGRRLRLCAAGPARWRPESAGAGAAGARRGRQPGYATDPRVLDLLGDQSVDLSRHRSRQGADPRRAVERRLPGAAGLARRILRQQHQSLRPHLAGPGPGRGG